MAELTPDDPYELEALRVRRELETEGRSESLLRLFDYLLAHSRDVRAPKEIEIAFEVFGKDARYDTSQNAMVRVYVHRLRGRLDEIYQGLRGPRLTVPKGEYRIVLGEESPSSQPSPNEDVAAPEFTPEATDNASSIARLSDGPFTRLAIFALVMTALGWSALFYVRGRSGVQASPAISAYRNADERCGVPLLVAGDSYLYFESGPGDRSRKLIMRPTIQSATQLGAIRSDETARGEQVRDLDDYYMSTGVADGLWSLLRTLSGRKQHDMIVPAVVPNSKLTPERLNGGNIVYFGRLDQLAALHDLVFQASRFTFDPVSDTLRDPGSRREFSAQLTDAINETDRNPLNRPAFAYDYGYLARIAKPNGCVVWIIAGLQDSALPQMARIAGNSSRLDALIRQARGTPSFEGLYEIRSLGSLRYKSRLILARSLETDR